ncbi:MAG: hypothetical protein QG657_3591 [Acidobacteriota bacterium]|nr:hypothetical protein [Acidobacteriota bacterium]
MIINIHGNRAFHIAPVLFSLFMLFHGLTAAALPPQSAAASEILEKAPHRVPMLDIEIRVDAALDEESWKDALKLELKYEVSPGENIPAPVRTEVYIYTTRTHLNVAFICHDSNPSAIRAPLSERDKLYSDDYVAILLDPFNDRQRRFNLFCNPLGVQADFSETTTNNYIEWDPIWESAGKITKTGYNVEMAIPFSSLRFPSAKGEQTWFFDIARSYPRDVRHGLRLVTFDRNTVCFVCQGEEMTGFENIKAGKKTIELDPTLTAVYTQERDDFPDGKFVKKGDHVGQLGLTARWSFTPNMTLAAAINPDFSTVEADAAQLDINTQFALYYQEKRTFFLEGANVFNTHLPIVYTRTLADPYWGVKLTGKDGANSIGFYSVQDNLTNLYFPSATQTQSTSLDMKSVATVLRYRRDIGKSSGLGVLVTDREGDHYYNRVVGVDADIWLTISDQVQVQFLAAQTRYPYKVANDFGQSTGKIEGSAFDVYYKHMSRNVEFYTLFKQISPGFRADLGFITQAGDRQMGGGFNYLFLHNPGYWYTEISLGPSFQYETDQNDNLLNKAVNFSLVYKGPLQSNVTVIGSLGKQFYMGKIFAVNNVDATIILIPSGKLQTNLHAIIGEQIDFDNIRQGQRILINPYLTYKIGRHISIDLDHAFERMQVESKRLYTANVTNFKFVYQFSRRAYLNTNLQYVNYNYNAENYLFAIDPKYKHLFTKILFSYTINPQTVLFLGYSDDHYGSLHIPLTQSNRTFFLKIGYALVM